MTVVTLRVKSRVESPVNRAVSRPAIIRITGLPAVDEPDSLERAENRFSACAGNAFTATQQIEVPVHRFRMGRTPETGLTPAEWREFPRYALVRILMHAVKTEPARFWRVFVVCCLFCWFRQETP